MWKPRFRHTMLAVLCIGVSGITGVARAQVERHIVLREDHQDLEIGRNYDRYIVGKGGHLKLKGNTTIRRGAELVVDPGGELEVEGRIEIKNGGRLRLNDHLRKSLTGKASIDVQKGGVLEFGRTQFTTVTVEGDLVNEGTIRTTRVGSSLGQVDGDFTNMGRLVLTDDPANDPGQGAEGENAETSAQAKESTAGRHIFYIPDPALFSVAGSVTINSGSVTVTINTNTGHYGRLSVAGNVSLGSPALYVTLQGNPPPTTQKFDIIRAYRIIGDFAAVPTTPHWRRVLYPTTNPTEYDLYYQ